LFLLSYQNQVKSSLNSLNILSDVTSEQCLSPQLILFIVFSGEKIKHAYGGKGIGRKISRGVQWKSQHRQILSISFPPV